MTPATAGVTLRRLLLPAALAALGPFVAVGSVHAAEPLGQRCTNPEVGYTVSFPTGWYVNAHVEGETEDVAACRLFSPREFQVRPGSETTGVSVAIGVQRSGPSDPGTPTTVGGRPAVVTEAASPPNPVEPAGTLHYRYWIDLGGGEWLLAGTSDGPDWVGPYEENKATLDAMMDTLAFEQLTLPNTSVGVRDRAAISSSATIALAVLVALAALAALVVGRRWTEGAAR